jgi:predicted nucleic acid-binding protein
MILVDTSVWVDHLRSGDALLASALERSLVVTHPFVVGELACGNLRNRSTVLALLQKLPGAPVATHAEVLAFIDARSLMGRGIGYVDVHLLASVMLEEGARLWTRDRSLATVAGELAVRFEE